MNTIMSQGLLQIIPNFSWGIYYLSFLPNLASTAYRDIAIYIMFMLKIQEV